MIVSVILRSDHGHRPSVFGRYPCLLGLGECPYPGRNTVRQRKPDPRSPKRWGVMTAGMAAALAGTVLAGTAVSSAATTQPTQPPKSSTAHPPRWASPCRSWRKPAASPTSSMPSLTPAQRSTTCLPAKTSPKALPPSPRNAARSGATGKRLRRSYLAAPKRLDHLPLLISQLMPAHHSPASNHTRPTHPLRTGPREGRRWHRTQSAMRFGLAAAWGDDRFGVRGAAGPGAELPVAGSGQSGPVCCRPPAGGRPAASSSCRWLKIWIAAGRFACSRS
jgi:hypothetical protein